MKELANKKWRMAVPNRELEKDLIETLHVNKIVARIISNRQLDSVEDAHRFFNADLSEMLDPFQLKGMMKSVERIEEAIEKKEKIVIYGDYDVDGITATSLLYRFFTKLHAKVSYYIPERQSEGYGLNIEALEHLIELGADLVITVDCGISSHDLVEQVKDRLNIIITDHHTPPVEIPDAISVINPKQEGCPYEDKNLSGVGVAFKLCQAIWYRKHGHYYMEDLDIVAIGTVADVVPLIGENRIFVREGLERINKNPQMGIYELIQVAGLSDKKITAGHIGFSLAPRLNASGRVTHATEGVKLLVTEDRQEAKEIAASLHETNHERQTIERGILEEARENVLDQGDLAKKVLVVAGEGWHQGVIGIVASRLVEEFYKPTLIISVADGIGKGSCRSIEAFDMYKALDSVKDLLIQFGGHKQAAGFSIESDKIPELRRRLTLYCEENLEDSDYLPVIDIDAKLEEEDISLQTINAISVLEPYGMANSTPVFSLNNIKVKTFFLMGSEKQHLKYILDINGKEVDAISWFGKDYLYNIFPSDRIRIAFTLQVNEWQGVSSPQLLIQDIQPMTEAVPHITKERLRLAYSAIRSLFKTPTRLVYQVDSEVIRYCPEGFIPKEMIIALEIFKELGIIKEEMSKNGAIYRWNQKAGKLDLVTSDTFIKYSS